MMGIMVPETCWASNKICNKNSFVASSWHFISTYYRRCTVKTTSYLLYTLFSLSSSSAVSLASLSASSLPSIPVCAFTHPEWIDQFCIMSCRTLFRISTLKGCVSNCFSVKLRSLCCRCRWLLFFRCGLKGMLVLPVTSRLLFVLLDCLNSSSVTCICTAFSTLGPHILPLLLWLCLRFCFHRYKSL